VGNDDTIDSKEGRRVVADYLKACLEEYVARGCEAPEWGEPFAPSSSVDGQEEKKEDSRLRKEKVEGSETEVETADGASSGKMSMDEKWAGKGNIVFRVPDDDDDGE